MKTGIVVFPGSNCDHDADFVIRDRLKQPSQFLWHKDRADLRSFDLVILPGGFSYGDYLRSGAVARFSPIMNDVIDFAGNGGFVLGICNGFQILLECGLLPGAMLKNRSLTFVCKDVHLAVVNRKTAFTCKTADAPLRIPVAHGEGNYFAPPEVVDQLFEKNQVVFRYSSSEGLIDNRSNPNGSVQNIAGIINDGGNVLGMMPHPERCSDPVLGGIDGLAVFESLMASITEN